VKSKKDRITNVEFRRKKEIQNLNHESTLRLGSGQAKENTKENISHRGEKDS